VLGNTKLDAHLCKETSELHINVALASVGQKSTIHAMLDLKVQQDGTGIFLYRAPSVPK
jgi:hypothetical protein